MRATVVLAFLCLLIAPARAEQHLALRLDFDSPEQMAMLEGDAGRLDGGFRSPGALLIERSDATGSAGRTIELPPERLAGRIVTLSAVVKAQNVSKRPRPWNGIKVMLVLQSGEHRDYPQVSFGVGTFDWTAGSRTFRAPPGLTAAHLVLGLEEVSGRAWFDNVEVRVGRTGRGGARSKTMFTGHTVPRLRGVMVSTVTNEQNVRELAGWGANLVRLQVNWTPMKKAEVWARDLDAYDRWLDGILPEVDRGLDLYEKHGFVVALDLHTPPGGRIEGGVCPMFTDRAAQDKLVEVWRRLARRYRGRKCIWAYDILNEPVEPPAGTTGADAVTWPELFARVVRAIREIEPGKPVIFEPGPWGSCGGFDRIGALELDRVIYSFHMYVPHQFTHQGVYGGKTGISYPGVIDGRMWNKERLREAMLPAIDFQKEFNVHIYVGEFSAIRWAPDESAYNYLRDCIELFEEYGWDWSYHAYREWDGWSVEHGPDPNDHTPTPAPTKRKLLLLEWFAKNVRPGR